MSTSERVLTWSEREILKPYSSAYVKRSNYLAFTGTSFALFWVAFIALSLLCDFISWMFAWPDFEISMWWLCGVSAVIALGYSVAEYRYSRSNEGVFKPTDGDLENGIAVAEHHEVVAVVEVEEEDDEGAGFLLELQDGRVLFLIGQHLYPYSLAAEPEEKMEADGHFFPSDKVEVVYAPLSGIVLDAKGTGAYLRPRSLVKWQGDGPRSQPYHGPIHDSFNEGPLKDLIERTGFIEEVV